MDVLLKRQEIRIFTELPAMQRSYQELQLYGSL